MKYELHPACAAWPQMTDKELDDLTADIKANGLLEPLTLDPAGLLLDGRNRALACERAGVTPTTVIHTGDPILFSLSKNKHRRHMSVDQIALVAATLEMKPLGANQREGGSNELPSIATIAAAAGVPETAVKAAKAVLRDGTADDIAAVRAGEAKLRATADRIRSMGKPPVIPRTTPTRDETKNVIRAHKALHGVYPSVIQAEKESGRSRVVVERALGEVVAEDNIAPQQPKLTKAQDTYIEARLKLLATQYQASFEKRVQEELNKRLAQRDLADVELVEKCREFIFRASGRTRPPFTNDEYKLVLAALHPDAQSDMRIEAFVLFKKKEFLLRSTDEKDFNKIHGIAPLPKTAEEWEARKRAVQDARKAKRNV